ncbi:MAG: hypothetical protein O3B87_01310 [bacterium]|nr:hypothetical protein [bacterium]
MNRETIIAISMGIVLGALVALVVFFQSNKTDETKVVPVAPNQATKDTTSQPSVPKLLSITSPEQGTVVDANTISITGKAPKNSLIIVQSASFESTFKSKEETFNVDVDLQIGENVIQLSAYTESSTPQQQTLRIYYIEE